MKPSEEDQLKAVEDFFKFSAKLTKSKKDNHTSIEQIKATVIKKYEDLKKILDHNILKTLTKSDSYLKKAFEMLTDNNDVNNDVDSDDENLNVEEYDNTSDDDIKYDSDSDFEYMEEASDNELYEKLKDEEASIVNRNNDGPPSPSKQAFREELKNAVQERIKLLQEKRGKFDMTENSRKKMLQKRNQKHEQNRKGALKMIAERKKMRLVDDKNKVDKKEKKRIKNERRRMKLEKKRLKEEKKNDSKKENKK